MWTECIPCALSVRPSVRPPLTRRPVSQFSVCARRHRSYRCDVRDRAVILHSSSQCAMSCIVCSQCVRMRVAFVSSIPCVDTHPSSMLDQLCVRAHAVTAQCVPFVRTILTSSFIVVRCRRVVFGRRRVATVRRDRFASQRTKVDEAARTRWMTTTTTTPTMMRPAMCERVGGDAQVCSHLISSLVADASRQPPRAPRGESEPESDSEAHKLK